VRGRREEGSEWGKVDGTRVGDCIRREGEVQREAGVVVHIRNRDFGFFCMGACNVRWSLHQAVMDTPPTPRHRSVQLCCA